MKAENPFKTAAYWLQDGGRVIEPHRSAEYEKLMPEDAAGFIEAAALGRISEGPASDLDSCENRVFRCRIENNSGEEREVVLKLYRPEQWSYESLCEEHLFMRNLAEAGVPLVVPVEDNKGNTLWEHEGIFFTVYPYLEGHSRDFGDAFPSDEQMRDLGRIIARMHEIGMQTPVLSRPELHPESFGRGNLQYLLRSGVLPAEYHNELEEIFSEIIELATPLFDAVPAHPLHGDLYSGNILWHRDRPYLLDFDDMMTGPAMQDIYVLIRGRDEPALHRRKLLIEGYREIRSFEDEWLGLLEPLRALRALWHPAWIARRAGDRRFRAVFPDFGRQDYWSSAMDIYRTQLRMIRS